MTEMEKLCDTQTCVVKKLQNAADPTEHAEHIQNLPYAGRRFCDFPSDQTANNSPADRATEQLKLLGSAENICQYIEDGIIGKDKVFSGPYGLRNALYCDYTASGRALSFIEDYVRQEVLPDYGNTHTTTTVTSLQTTLFRHEARDIVRNAVNASEHDAVLFVGSGCTGAVHKLIHALNLTRLVQPPVVFVDPYAHHSSLLPWRELGGEVIRIQETETGLIDLNDLENQLEEWQNRGRELIGCFAAASNVSGILVDVDRVTVMLHKYGALALWDYATAGPYVEINMNPGVGSGDPMLAFKDAVFLSAHKFVGGVQTPGILIAKKKLFMNPVPSGCGGGSVFFVRREAHRYLQETEMREEGGTPAIVESIRAGLVFQLKEAVGVQNIATRDEHLCRLALSAWREAEGLVLLGSPLVPRLPVFSFLIQHPGSGLYLHHNFICTILNDVFGIQARGGCACAGPYAQDVLGISENCAVQIENLLAEDSRLDRTHLRRYREYSDKEILRPGFARVNLPYFMSTEAVDFVLEAVKLTALHAWKLLPQYTFNPETGEWRHRGHQVFKDRKWLGFITYQSSGMTYRQPPCPEKGPLPCDFQDCLEKAKEVFTQAEKVRVELGDQRVMFPGEADRLRWFLLPSEALYWLRHPSEAAALPKHPLPFQPPTYPLQPKPCRSKSPSAKVISENFKPEIKKPLKTSNAADCTTSGNTETHLANCSLDDCESSIQYSYEEKSTTDSGSPLTAGSEPEVASFQAAMSDVLSSGFISNYLSEDKTTDKSITNNENNYQTFCSSTSEFHENAVVVGVAGRNCTRTDTTGSEQSNFSSGSASIHQTTCTGINTTGSEQSNFSSGSASIHQTTGINTTGSEQSDFSSGSASIHQTTGSEQSNFSSGSASIHQTTGINTTGSEQSNFSSGSASIHQTTGINTTGSEQSNFSSGSASIHQTTGSEQSNFSSGSASIHQTTGINTTGSEQSNFSSGSASIHQTTGINTTGSEQSNFSSGSASIHQTTGSEQSNFSSGSASIHQTTGSEQSNFSSGSASIHQTTGINTTGSEQSNFSSGSASIHQTTCTGINTTGSEQSNFSSGSASIHQTTGINTTDSEQSNFSSGSASIHQTTGSEQSNFSSGSASIHQTTGINKFSHDSINPVKHKLKHSSEAHNMLDSKSDNSKDNVKSKQMPPKAMTSETASSNLSQVEESTEYNHENSENRTSYEPSEDPSRVMQQSACPDGLCFMQRKENVADQTVAPPSGIKWHCPPKTIFKPTVEALEEHDMVRNGDRILVCLSGGKDSLSLLHTLHQYQYYARSKGINFDLGAVTVDPLTNSYDPRPLKPYLSSLGVEYFYEEQAILEAAAKLPYECASICSFCSRMKRGRIYAAARRGKYNVLAFGQHLDDLAESFLMSVFHNGLMRTMKACYSVEEGDLRVIRPFVYVREKDLRQFAEQRKLPVIPENCPACFEAPKERHRMKQLLAAQEVLFPRLFPSLQAALRPLMAINKTGVNINSLLSKPDKNGEPAQDEDYMEF